MSDDLQTSIFTMHRRDDWSTSVSSAKKVQYRTGSQKAKLLVAYASEPGGMTDEEAGLATGLIEIRSCCYWKRCGDLRQDGFIEPTGGTRRSSAGHEQMVCRITDSGLTEVQRLR